MSSNKKKKRELKDFRPDEVSFVAAGANMKQKFLIKNENGETDMPNSLPEQLKDFKFADETRTEKALDELCEKEGLTGEQRSSMKTALAVMESMASDEKLRGFSFNTDEGYASISVYKSEAEEPVVEEEATEEVTPVVPEEVAPVVPEEVEKSAVPTAIQKQLDDQAEVIRVLKEKSDSDDARIAKEENSKVEKEYIQKATELPYLAESTELGLLLKKCSEVLDGGEYSKLEGILKSANVKIEKGDLFKELGKNHSQKGDLDGEALVDAKAEEIRKANPEYSIQKARVEARIEIAKDSKTNI